MILNSDSADMSATTSLQISDFIALAKVRVVLMVLLTTAAGYYLGMNASSGYLLLLPTLLGTGVAAAGTMALNEYMERDIDSLMKRTSDRPLPAGRMDPTAAFTFGVVTTLLGLASLAWAVNLASAAVVAVIAASYLLAYTPLKRISPVCTIVGAVPGALPPVVGWVAVTGNLGIEAWVLFAIMFLWQLPHSLAIGALYAEDYGNAGIRLLPVVEPDGRSTGRQVVMSSLALLAVGLLPTLVGLAGAVYFAVALLLGLVFLGYGIAYARARDRASAKSLMMASLLYLPLLLFAMAVDKIDRPVVYLL